MNLATKNFLFSLGGSLVGAVGSLLISIMISRSLGPDGRGLLTQIIIWPPIIANLIHAGWSIGITSRVSVNPENSSRISASAFQYGTLFSLFGLAICYFGLLIYKKEVVDILAAQLFLLYIPLATFECISRALLEGIHKFRETSIIRSVVSIANAFVIFLLWTSNELSITSYVISYLLILKISFFSQLYIFKKIRNETYVNIIIGQHDNTWAKVAFNAIPYVLIGIIVTRFDLVLISQKFSGNVRDIGLYVAASSIGGGLTLTAQSIVYALIPRISTLEKSFDPKSSSNYLSTVLVIISIGMGVLLVPFGEYFMEKIFGENFKAASIYILPSIIYATTGGLVSISLSQDAADGKWRDPLLALALIVIINLIGFNMMNIENISDYVYFISATYFITLLVMKQWKSIWKYF